MKINNLTRYVIAIVTIIMVGLIVWYFADIVAYLIIAWVLSLLGGPFMRLFRRIKIGRFQVGPNIAAVMTLASFFLIIGLIFSLFVPLVLQQARNLADVDAAAVVEGLEGFWQPINETLIERGLIEPSDESISEYIRTRLVANFSPTRVTDIFSAVIGFTGNLFIAIFSIIFITFFFLKEDGLFMRMLLILTPNKYQSEVANVIERIVKLLTRYFGGILFQITIMTIFVSTLLGLLNIQNALLIAFFAAVVNVIPYIGPTIGAVFGIFIAVSSNLDAEFTTVIVPMVAKVVIVFALMQMLDNFILQPFIFSNSVMAHPLEIFIIILLGAKLGSILGMVLAIPVYTILRVIGSVFLSEFKVVQKLTERMDEV